MKTLHGNRQKRKGLYACEACGAIYVGKQRGLCFTCNEDITPVYFASQGEHRRWCELLTLQKAGEVAELRRQVSYPLRVDHSERKPLGKYVADFVYDEAGETVVEEYHPVDTPLSKWKRKHFAAQYGREIRVTS